jgi:hypothetical protein
MLYGSGRKLLISEASNLFKTAQFEPGGTVSREKALSHTEYKRQQIKP